MNAIAMYHFILLFALLPTHIVLAQTNGGDELPQLQQQFLSPWTITIEGDTVRLVVIIKGVSRTTGSAFALDTAYGQVGGNKGRLKEAFLFAEPQGRKLLLTTSAGNKMEVAQKSEGVFEGTFTTAKGVVRPVVLTRVSTQALRDREDAIWAEKTAKPKPDVPASCAGFLGRWTGDWPYYGRTRLWVSDIDANCVAKYAHVNDDSFPMSFNSVTIKDGVLADADAQGNGNYYELRNGELWARHQEPGRGNNALFRRF